MSLTRLSCPGACGYTTEEVELKAAMEHIRMHRDIAHATTDVDTPNEGEVIDSMYNLSGEETVKVVEAELVRDEATPVGLFGNSMTETALTKAMSSPDWVTQNWLEEQRSLEKFVNDRKSQLQNQYGRAEQGSISQQMQVPARTRKHQQVTTSHKQEKQEVATQQKQNPSNPSQSRKTLEQRTVQMQQSTQPFLSREEESAKVVEAVTTNHKQVKQKIGPKRARKRQRVQDARSRQHQQGDKVPLLLKQMGEVPIKHQQRDNVPLLHHQRDEVPLQQQQSEVVPDQQRDKVPDQHLHQQRGDVPDQDTYQQVGKDTVQNQQGDHQSREVGHHGEAHDEPPTAGEHDDTTMAPARLTCPASTSCGYVTPEVALVGLEGARELVKWHMYLDHSAVHVQHQLQQGDHQSREDGRHGEAHDEPPTAGEHDDKTPAKVAAPSSITPRPGCRSRSTSP